MSRGFLKLTFRDDSDGTGKLLVEAEGGGFAGRGGAYFDKLRLESFAGALGEFPLPDSQACCLSSGFSSKQMSGELEQEHVGIDLYPIDNRGHIGVQVRLSTEVWPDTRPKSHKVVKLEVITTYQALADFSRDLVAAVRGTATDAVLRGEMLP
ncbi:MAG: hypothetical protein WBZ11_03660 [Candidatus Sulfotelmatobacter sp.]